MNQSITFLREIDDLSRREIPARVLDRARQSLLDYLAVTCAGAGFQKKKLENYLAFAQPEEGIFPAIGMGLRLALKEAVFLNGLNAHALDYDDGTNAGIIHLGSPVFSLLLPLALRHGIGLEDMLRAAVIGYETSYTMAISIQPGHKALGYHATGTCGVLGAAVAAAYMLDFTEEERFQAFACACVSATGMLKVLDDGSELKPYNVAKTALLALTSIQMAKAGFQGHPDPLGGARGFFKMMTGKETIEMRPLLLGGSYAVEKSYTKPYASCRYTHPSIEAAIRFREDYGLKPNMVESIQIRTYSLAVAGHDHTEIPGSYSAKMSIPYSVAAALISGKAGLEEFSEDRVRDPETLALTRKVQVAADEAISAAFPGRQTAVVSLRTRNDETLEETVDYPKGEPENPMSEEEFRARYDGLMAFGGIDREISAKIFDGAYEKNVPVRYLLDLL